MKPHEQLESIFAQAMGYADHSVRGDFLDRACEGNRSLRQRLGRLLVASDRASDFMSEPASVLKLSNGGIDAGLNAIGEQPGDQVGPYELMEALGEGGMGTVFRAEQQEPVHRQVALKIIKPGLDTKEVIARFEIERQALALMNHPHIASALDAGATESGRPYFVMELVRGDAITAYCNRARLTLRQRLELFRDVCDAVQHAHQKGIIHRDIKPHNVLVEEVDGQPVAKVIDFGIAKAVDQRLTEQTLLTRYGEFIGTPAYMSPEQAQSTGKDIDTRTDIYSLGALLYELLTGLPPFDEDYLKQLEHDEMRRVIQHETPRKPSEAVDTRNEADATKVSQVCGDSRREWRNALSGELNWIVSRAMEKDRERRYETANALSQDVRRYLVNEPVVARPPTLAYRWQKLLIRHRSAVLTGAFIAVTLLVATMVSGWWAWQATLAQEKSEEHAHQAEVARLRAEDEAESLREVVAFINEDLFGNASPTTEPNRNLSLRRVLDRASSRLNAQTFARPAVEASVRATLGDTYRVLGEYDSAAAHLSRALELRQANLGKDHEKSLESANQLAATLLHQSKLKEAQRLLTTNLVTARRVLGDTHETTLSAMNLTAWQLELSGEPQRAEALLAEVLRIRREHGGGGDVETLKAMANLAYVYQSQARLDEALELLLPSYEGLSGQAAARVELLQVASHLASLYVARNELDQAESLYRDAMTKTQSLLGNQHSQALTIRHGLALILAAKREYQAAKVLFEVVLEGQREQLGVAHLHTLATLHNLALLEGKLGNHARAEELFREEIAGRRMTLDEQHPTTLAAVSSLASLLMEQDRFSEAVPLYDMLSVAAEQGDAVDSLTTAMTLGLCQYKSDDLEAARDTLQLALRRAEAALPDDWVRFAIEGLLGEVQFAMGQRELAEELLLRSYEGLMIFERDVPPRWQPLGLRAAMRRLLAFYESDDSAEARSRAETYRNQWKSLEAVTDPETGASEIDEERNKKDDISN